MRAKLALLSLLFAAATKRPSFKKPFPDPALFHPSRGRRLAAEGEKPERLHFEVEDGGYQFHYDFGGIATVEHVFDLDSEGVEGISCTPGQHGYDRLQIEWSNLTVAKAANLQRDVVLTGAPEWHCTLSNSSRKSSRSSNFLAKILKVEKSGLSTELRVLPISPVQLFRNLYMDLSWEPVEKGRQLQWSNGRELQSSAISCGFFTWGLNYDCEDGKAKRSYTLGPLTCSDCYAALEVTPRFKLETNSWGAPTKVALTLGATFEVNFELTYDSSSRDDGWKPLFEGQLSSNLINSILSFTMPMFGSLVAKLNSWTINMGIYVMYLLKGRADLQSNLEGTLQTRRTFEWSGAEVGWTRGKGFGWSLGTISDSGFTNTPELADFSADLHAGLAPCAGLELNFGDETMSEVSACLEGHVAYATAKATTSVAASSVSATSEAYDAELCVDIYKFRTNGKLDTWWSYDEPYAAWCFFGKCFYRDYVYFSGNTAKWSEGYVCMNIQRTWLESNKLHLQVWEDDQFWFDDEYIERYSQDLKTVSEVDWKLTCTPSSAGGGDWAYLYLKIQINSLRLLQTAPASSSCGQSLYAGSGMHGGFSGFVIPSLWGHGGTTLVDPVETPSYRSQMSQKVCKELPTTTSTTTTSTTTTTTTSTTTTSTEANTEANTNEAFGYGDNSDRVPSGPSSDGNGENSDDRYPPSIKGITNSKARHVMTFSLAIFITCTL